MGWHDRLVYYRDFAYSTPRLRMATGNIGLVPAASFAEYVDAPPPGAEADDAQDARARRGQQPEQPQQPQQRAPCVAVRPGLAHRLYSHRLHVRAKAKLQRDRLLSGPMIDVYVGEARRRWTLHRNLLCHHSEQLEAELEGGPGHARKDALELPEHAPAGFELLVKWLYQGRLDDVGDLPDAAQKYDYAVHCHALYLLCLRLDMPHLKNVAMDQFRKGLHQAELVPDPDEIDDLYRRTPPASPFRRLLASIAARQIMDPDGDRDADAYRQCFDRNPDFAVELVNAIRRGTAGVLLDDPTDRAHDCDYHDHDDGPNCHAATKPRPKQAPKARAPPPTRSSARSTASTSSAPLTRPHPRPPSPPLPPPLPPSLRQPRPGSSPAGPLLRRLTSPATSTAGTSTQTAVATHPPTPDATKDWEKLKKAITPERPAADQVDPPKPPPAPEERRQSSEDGLRPQQLDAGADPTVALNGSAHQSPPGRGIWEWARAGTGKLNIMARLPRPEWKGPASAPSAEALVVNGVHDDFEIPSATASEPENMERQERAAAAKIEGLGISSFGPIMSPNDFSQTKRSSDDLIANASETTGSPSPRIMRQDAWTEGNDTTPTASKPTSPTAPETPTPPQRRSDSIMEVPKLREMQKESLNDINSDTVSQALRENMAALGKHPDEARADAESASTAPIKTNGNANSSQRRVPTYKIALASSLLSPARRSASTAH